jgi:hypothetical protein
MANLNKKKRKEIWDKHINIDNRRPLGKEWELLSSIEFNLGDHEEDKFSATVNNEIDNMINGGNDAQS